MAGINLTWVALPPLPWNLRRPKLPMRDSTDDPLGG